MDRLHRLLCLQHGIRILTDIGHMLLHIGCIALRSIKRRNGSCVVTILYNIVRRNNKRGADDIED